MGNSQVLDSRKLSSVAFVLPTDDKHQVWDSVLSNAPSTPEIERLRQLDVAHVMIVWFKSSDTLVLVKGVRDSLSDYIPAVYAARYLMLDAA